ncbi:MAG: hypothetical protein ACOC5L_02865 [Halobacteriota archaeon]
MKIELSYKMVYLAIVAFFAVTFILSLTNGISSSFVLNYSLFGIIVTSVVYSIDSKFISNVYSERERQIKLEKESDVNKLLDKRIWLFWSMVIVLGVGFIVLFIPLVF